MNKSIDFITRHHGQGDPMAAIIWLHGLGANGYDFVDTIPMLHLPSQGSIHFYFPHAPSQPVTLNGGQITPAWFDILDIGENVEQDYAGINAMMPKIHALIDEAILLTKNSQRVFLVGFSQGGAMALHAGLRYSQPLGGMVGLSTYLPVAHTLSAEAHPLQKNTPMLLAHGTADPIVPYYFGHRSQKILEEQGYSVMWKSYPIAHTICQEEFKDLGEWFMDHIPK